MKTLEKKITVFNRKGVHSRVATKLAGIADKYNVKLAIVCHGEVVDCSSVLDVLGMSLSHGSSCTIRVSGADPARTISAVEALFHERNEK